MSIDWKNYWSIRSPLRNGTVDDALVQVGKTQFGQPVDASQLTILVNHVANILDLGPRARTLDLGCGNGLVTRALAKRVGHVIAFDYSPILLKTAKTNFSGPNIVYHEADLTRMDETKLSDGAFEAAWSIEVIQNLDPNSLIGLLRWLANKMSSKFHFLVSGIPDISRIRAFYDTEERWQQHLLNTEAGREQMGRWWSSDELTAVANSVDLKVRFESLPSNYYTAHYRLDAVFWRG